MKIRYLAILAVIVVILAAATVYVTIAPKPTTPTEKPPESKVRMEVVPSTPRVNESVTWTIYMTNGESSTMTINSLTITAYKDNQLGGTLEVGPENQGWITGTVPTGETVAVFRTSGVVGGHEVGNWKMELTCYTNFGDLQTTFTYTVLEGVIEWGEGGAEILRSFDSPCNDPEGLAWDGSHLWCGDWDSHGIYKINPETGEVVASFDFPGGPEAGPGGLAWDGDYLWCGNRPANIIYKINPHTGAVIRTIDFPGYGGSAGLAWDGSYLWCGDANGNWIYKIDPMTGELIKSFQVLNYCEYTQGLAWDGTYLWGCGVEEGARRGEENNKIYKIDPDSGEVISYVCSPTSPTPSIEPAGLAWAGDSLWYVEKKDGAAIYREGGGRIYKLAVPSLTYANQKFGFKVDFPENWRLFSEKESKVRQAITVWFWHKNNTAGKFPLAEPPLWGAYVLIAVSLESEATTLEELKDMKVVGTGENITYEEPTVLGGEPAWERTGRLPPSSGVADGTNFTSYTAYHEIFTLYGGRDYEIEFSIGYSYPENQIPSNPYEPIERDFKKLEADFEVFLRTFEFIP